MVLLFTRPHGKRETTPLLFACKDIHFLSIRKQKQKQSVNRMRARHEADEERWSGFSFAGAVFSFQMISYKVFEG